MVKSWPYGQPNAINLPFGNGWNPTRKNGDDLGMVYGIAFTTLVIPVIDIIQFLVGVDVDTN